MNDRLNRAEGDVDRIVHQRFFSPGDSAGRVFVDVGAARPDFLSIGAYYRALGWRVIGIEANPEFCKLHRDRGHEIYQYACGQHDEDDVDFTVVDSHGAGYENGEVSFESFSSLGIKPSYASLKADLDCRRIKVRLRRLDSILTEHAREVEGIDILSIDVEGWELEVLDGFDLPRYQPRVMIIENWFNDEKYRVYMKRNGYILWQQVYPNDIYVSRREVGYGVSGWRIYFEGYRNQKLGRKPQEA